MFAKIMIHGDRFKYITNVKDIDGGPVKNHFTESLKKQGYKNVPEGVNEVCGRMLTVTSADDGDVLVFCDKVIYLCSETGQTVDRILCSGGPDV